MPHKKAYDKVKISLLMDPALIFYSSILFSLEIIWTDDFPTAATNGKIIKINPEFFMSLTHTQRIGVILHEVMHVAFKHMLRLGDKDALIFNMAGDVVINNQLLEDNYDLPDGALHDPNLKKYNTEQIYDIYYRKMQQNSQSQQNGDIPGTGKDLIYTAPGTVESKQLEEEVTTTILQAATQAEIHKQSGSIPGEVKIMLEEFLNPLLPWNVILANRMQKYAKGDFTYKRPNKRFQPDFYLPSLYSETLADVAIVIDISGSLQHAEINQFLTEVTYIQQQLKPEKIHLIAFDTRIRKEILINQETNIFQDIELKGGGGTDIAPVLNWIHKNKPAFSLIFTDGCFYTPGNLDICQHEDIIWLIKDNPDFTWKYGTVIHYK